MQYPSILHSARGVGTFCAISFKDQKTRDEIATLLMQKGKIAGINVGLFLVSDFLTGVFINSCGTDSLRFRPALIFQPKHANILLNIFEEVVKDY